MFAPSLGTVVLPPLPPTKVGAPKPLTTPSGALADFRMRRAAAGLKSGVVSRATLAEAAGYEVVGGTYAAQLADKCAKAKAALERYTKLGAYDSVAAEAAIVVLEQWKASHASTWAQIEAKLLPSDSNVQPQDMLEAPAGILRAYVEALYQTAASGLRMYTSGTFSRMVDTGQITNTFVRDDATARLSTLDSILGLEESGTLGRIYFGDASATKPLAGLGALPVIPPQVLIGIAIVVGIVALVAGVAYYRQTKVGSDLATSACQAWIDTKDPVFKGSCEPDTDAVKIAKYAIGAAAVVTGAYLLFPGLMKELQRKAFG